MPLMTQIRFQWEESGEERARECVLITGGHLMVCQGMILHQEKNLERQGDS